MQPAAFPPNGPITSDHTPTPAAASGTVVQKVATGTIPCSRRCFTKSMRRKKIHVGACSANASGRDATAEGRGRGRGGGGGGEGAVVGVGRGHDRRADRDRERKRRRQRQLEREGALE